MTDLVGSGIHVVFGRGDAAVYAVTGATITVGAGEIVGLVGESGSGKTTLGRVLAGMQRATAGEVLLDQAPIASAAHAMSRESHRKIQMILQDPYTSLNPTLRAADCVAEVFQVCHGLSRGVALHEAFDGLSQVGISAELAVRYPRHLSGGQRQRVSIARALAAKPGFLVADEPTSAIDQSAQAQVLHLLGMLNESKGLGILFVTHDLRVVNQIAGRVYVMHLGEIVESGKTADIFSNPTHSYTTSLIEAIPGRKLRVQAARPDER
jgi:peptide/nickel transport system ATP-binding protein